MRVLVGCEFSGIVRDAFIAEGHDAMSCDLLPTATPGPHYEGNVLDIIEDDWDLAIFHPPCTYLTCAAEWCYKDNPGKAMSPGVLFGEDRRKAREEAIEFVRLLLNAPVTRLAVENPVGVLSSRIRRPDQIIQPYDFGEDASKKTCLWLKNLPLLQPTKRIQGRIVNGKERWANQTDSGQNKLGPSPDRWAERSLTYPGIASAMAKQWGSSGQLQHTT